MEHPHAELIANGITGLQMAAGQTLPEEGMQFTARQGRLQQEESVRIVPLDGSSSYTLSIAQEPGEALLAIVQKALAANASGKSGIQNTSDNVPKV